MELVGLGQGGGGWCPSWGLEMWGAGGLQGRWKLEHHQLGPKLPISAWLCYLRCGFPPGTLKPTPQSKAGVGWLGRQVPNSLHA